MVCIRHNNFISPEARKIIESRAYHLEGLRALAALLPTDDVELHACIRAAIETNDEDTFHMVLSAAAMGDRKLPAEFILGALQMQFSAWSLAWIAWRMEGNVTEALLHGLETVPVVTAEGSALLLVVAVAWWQEHRKGEELPKQVERLTARFQRGSWQQADTRTQYLIANLGTLLVGKELARRVARDGKQFTSETQRRLLRKTFKHLEGPYERLVNQRENNDYVNSQPQRRAVAELGRNDDCHCGSGKKYKDCCWLADRKRLARSSSIPGVTRDELAAGTTGMLLTDEMIFGMSAATIAGFHFDYVPEEMQEKFVGTLDMLGHHDRAIEALRKFGVTERLRPVWALLFQCACEQWRPNHAKQLMELLPDAEEKVELRMDNGLRLLLAGDDPADALKEMVRSAEALLKSGDVDQLAAFSVILLGSPYRSLGILVARGLLQIAAEDTVDQVFDRILDARAKLELPPEDEFSEWMTERALRKARAGETAESQEIADALERAMQELRAIKEERARENRDVKLRGRQERRLDEEAKSRSAAEEAQARESERQHKAKIDRLNALLKEKNEEIAGRRRAAKQRELDEAKAAAGDDGESAGVNGSGGDETFEVEGNQPVRLLKFPKGFLETVNGFPKHVGRATMARLGQLSAGVPSAFHGVKQLKAYPGVLRARVSDKYRLLFWLEADRVRVIDLIRRADLDQRIERLLAAGLPPLE